MSAPRSLPAPFGRRCTRFAPALGALLGAALLAAPRPAAASGPAPVRADALAPWQVHARAPATARFDATTCLARFRPRPAMPQPRRHHHSRAAASAQVLRVHPQHRHRSASRGNGHAAFTHAAAGAPPARMACATRRTRFPGSTPAALVLGRAPPRAGPRPAPPSASALRVTPAVPGPASAAPPSRLPNSSHPPSRAPQWAAAPHPAPPAPGTATALPRTDPLRSRDARAEGAGPRELPPSGGATR